MTARGEKQPPPVAVDPEDLRRLYVAQCLPNKEIAEILGISERRVDKLAREFGWRRQPRPLGTAELRELADEGRTDEEIAAEYGWTVRRIAYRLKLGRIGEFATLDPLKYEKEPLPRHLLTEAQIRHLYEAAGVKYDDVVPAPAIGRVYRPLQERSYTGCAAARCAEA